MNPLAPTAMAYLWATEANVPVIQHWQHAITADLQPTV